MSDDEFTGIQKKLLGWLLIAVLGGNTGVILLNKSNPQMRSDPFTGSDAKELEKSLKDYFEQKLFIHKLQIPPIATRKRIYSLEEWVHDQDPSYERPTDQWLTEMKLLMYRGKSLVSKAIKLQTRSPYSHAAVQFSDGKIIEAWHTGGKWPWEGTVRWIAHPWEGHSPNTPVDTYLLAESYEEDAAREYAELQTGKKYDFSSVFRFVSRRDAASNDKMFCSELAWEICNAGGLVLLHANPAHLAPGHLVMSPHTYKLK